MQGTERENTGFLFAVLKDFLNFIQFLLDFPLVLKCSVSVTGVLFLKYIFVLNHFKGGLGLGELIVFLFLSPGILVDSNKTCPENVSIDFM